MIKLEDVLKIHNLLIDQFGGSHGVRDMGALNSAINRPFATFDKQNCIRNLLNMNWLLQYRRGN
jgi:prophage maintenance system killer protein